MLVANNFDVLGQVNMLGHGEKPRKTCVAFEFILRLHTVLLWMSVQDAQNTVCRTTLPGALLGV